MTKIDKTQSLADFQDNATETMQRLNANLDPEHITVNGRTEGVLIAPAVYDELIRQIDFATSVTRIRKSTTEISDGKFRNGFEALGELRSRLLAILSKPES